MIHGVPEIRDAYRDEEVARHYIDERFRAPLGALLHARQASTLRRVVARERPGRTLEIAPGPARLTVEVGPLLPRGGTVVDTSAPMLCAARRRLGAIDCHGWRFVQGDAFRLPFRTEFDLVYTFRLIRHFEVSERARLYAEIARILRPRGLLVFDAVNETVSAGLRARARPGEYQHFDALFRPESLRAEVAAAGLEVLSLEGVQHRYGVLSQLQVLLAPRSRPLARLAMEAVDRLGGGEPLEWIVTCRRV